MNETSTAAAGSPPSDDSQTSTSRAHAGRAISANIGDVLVSCRGLRKSFGDREVMKSIDFDMRAGDITVIIGRSGSGKSTLLRAIAGLTDPDDGEMTFDGEVVFSEQKRTPAWKQVDSHVGMIFQSYTLWPHMDVLKNLTLAPRKRLGMSESESLERAEKALAEVGMSDHIRSKPVQLSGGERQRDRNDNKCDPKDCNNQNIMLIGFTN